MAHTLKRSGPHWPSRLSRHARPGHEPESLSGDLLIRDVRTMGFDGETPAIRENAYVLVKDGKILAVRDTAEGLSAPETWRVPDRRWCRA
jgi:hypothetical protein